MDNLRGVLGFAIGYPWCAWWYGLTAYIPSVCWSIFKFQTMGDLLAGNSGYLLVVIVKSLV